MKNNNSGNMKKKLVSFLPYILIPVMLIFGLTFYINNQSQEKTEYYELVALFDEGKVTEYNLNLSSGALKYYVEGDKQEKNYTVPNVSLFIEDIHEGVSNTTVKIRLHRLRRIMLQAQRVSGFITLFRPFFFLPLWVFSHLLCSRE